MARRTTDELPEDAHRTVLAQFGASVRARRQDLGLTVKQLAERSGLSERFIGLVEQGEGNPALTRLIDLSRALGCAISELVRENDDGNKPIVALLGLRGAGKTSVGKALAHRMRCAFVELDQRVEQEAGMKLGEIFALHGEDYYRRLEVAALEKLVDDRKPAVVATGGGIVTNKDAMQLLKRSSRTVWLRAPVQAHWERVVAQGDRRPMANKPDARAELDSIYAQRAPLYARADLVVDTATLDVTRVSEKLFDQLRG